LRRKLDALAKQLYGKSSEQLAPDELQLLLKGLEDPKKHEASSNEESSEPEEAAVAKRKKTKAKNNSRVKGLDSLPVEEHTEYPPEFEANPDDYEVIGHEVTDLLDYQPACCIRQQGILQRCGIHIPRNTLNHWTLTSLEILEPVVAVIRQETLTADYLQGDETPLRLLQPGKGKTAISYFWVYNDPSGSLSYHWSPNRAASNLTDTLGLNYNGILQCDGYSAYTSYQKSNRDTTLGSCMAHIRRKFHKALQAKERHAALIMKLIGNLYSIEESLRKQRAGPALRHAIRASQAKPILKRLENYLTKLKSQHYPQSGMGQAINYALGQWSGLDAYLLDGRVELDNNLIENAIRPTKLGQKNWLFLGSERGGEMAAVAFTVIENCKRYGLDLRDDLASTMKALIEQGPTAAASLTPKALTTHPDQVAEQAA